MGKYPDLDKLGVRQRTTALDDPVAEPLNPTVQPPNRSKVTCSTQPTACSSP